MKTSFGNNLQVISPIKEVKPLITYENQLGSEIEHINTNTDWLVDRFRSGGLTDHQISDVKLHYSGDDPGSKEIPHLRPGGQHDRKTNAISIFVPVWINGAREHKRKTGDTESLSNLVSRGVSLAVAHEAEHVMAQYDEGLQEENRHYWHNQKRMAAKQYILAASHNIVMSLAGVTTIENLTHSPTIGGVANLGVAAAFTGFSIQRYRSLLVGAHMNYARYSPEEARCYEVMDDAPSDLVAIKLRQ